MTPSDMGANASMDSVIDSAFDAAPAPETPSESPAEITSPETTESAEAEEPGDAPVEETPQEEKAPEPEATPEPEPQTEQEEDADYDDDLSKPDRVSKDGKLYYYKPNRVKQFIASHQAWKAANEAVPGLTVDQIRDMHKTAAVADDFMADIESGQPQQVDRALDFLLGENPQQQARNAATIAARTLVKLGSVNPQALQSFENVALRNHIQRLYAEAAQTGDPETIALVQRLDLKVSGKYMKRDELTKRDVMAEREQAISAREQEFKDRLAAEHQQFVEKWTADTRKAAEVDAVDQAIEDGLKAVKTAFENNPRGWKNMKRDLRDSVDEMLKNNPTWKRQYDAAFKRTQLRPTEEGRQQLVSMMRQFANQAITKNRKAVIDAESQTVMSASAAAHKKLAAAATRKEPTNAGVPVASNRFPNKELDSAKSLDDLFKAVKW